MQLLSYVAQTEREFIRQRQAEGIAAAKERGVHLGRKPMERPDLSKVFQQNSTPQAGPCFAVIDRKRRREMLDKRIAMGHREGDHEEMENYKYTEPSMSMW